MHLLFVNFLLVELGLHQLAIPFPASLSLLGVHSAIWLFESLSLSDSGVPGWHKVSILVSLSARVISSPFFLSSNIIATAGSLRLVELPVASIATSLVLPLISSEHIEVFD